MLHVQTSTKDLAGVEGRLISEVERIEVELDSISSPLSMNESNSDFEALNEPSLDEDQVLWEPKNNLLIGQREVIYSEKNRLASSEDPLDEMHTLPQTQNCESDSHYSQKADEMHDLPESKPDGGFSPKMPKSAASVKFPVDGPKTQESAVLTH